MTSWVLKLRPSGLLALRLVFGVREGALELNLSKDDPGLLVDGAFGSCRRFLEPGLVPGPADILHTIIVCEAC